MEYLLLLVFVAVYVIHRSRDSGNRRGFESEILGRIESLERRIGQLETQRAPAGEEKHPEPAANVMPVADAAPSGPLSTSYPSTPVAPEFRTAADANPATIPAASEVIPPHLLLDGPSVPSDAGLSLSQISDKGGMRAYVRPEDSAPVPPREEAPSPRQAVSLEERLGANWLNKLGIVTLVFGIAFFLIYQLKNLGPLGKVVIGFTVSAALLLGGLVLERRQKYRIFARAGIGGGWALTFFLAYALYHISATQILQSQTIDLILMLITAAGMVWHSLRYKSQVLTGLAFLLAFSTVAISHVSVFTLVASALLAAGLVFVTGHEHWAELELTGLIAVYTNHFLWLYRTLPPIHDAGHVFPDFRASVGLLLLYWLIFRVVYVWSIPRSKQEDLINSVTAVLNSAGVLLLLKYQSAHPEWSFWALLGMGAAEITFAFAARRRRRSAFVVLSTIASALLLAAIPFRYKGAHWSLLWLLETEVLVVLGIRLREAVFRWIGLAAGLASFFQLGIAEVLPILLLRADRPDPTVHWIAGLVVTIAAVFYWFNSLFAPRRWPEIAVSQVESAAYAVTSYLGLLAAAFVLWIFFPASGTVIAWMALVIALGYASDRLDSGNLALHADLLTGASILRVLLINLEITGHWGWWSQRALSMGVVGGLCYVGARRRKGAAGLSGFYVPAAYSWAASALLAILLWYELEPVAVAVGWVVLALILLEVGILRDRGYLRQQAVLLLGISFVRLFFANLNAGDAGQLFSPRLYTVLPLIAAYFWSYERLKNAKSATLFERRASTSICLCGTIAAATLIYFEMRAEWVVMAWAALALSSLFIAQILVRRLFVIQAFLLALAVLFRGVAYNLRVPPLSGTNLWESAVVCVGIAAAILFLMLPSAFRIRAWDKKTEFANHPRRALEFTVSHPEQILFFVPLLLTTVMLAHEMRAGMITVAWSALGVSVFLVALLVRERSYRLAGLGLLLLGVAKILAIDIWKLAPNDRYITLIVMGIALLLVSFLYTRYREVIVKLL